MSEKPKGRERPSGASMPAAAPDKLTTPEASAESDESPEDKQMIDRITASLNKIRDDDKLWRGARTDKQMEAIWDEKITQLEDYLIRHAGVDENRLDELMDKALAKFHGVPYSETAQADNNDTEAPKDGEPSTGSVPKDAENYNIRDIENAARTEELRSKGRRMLGIGDASRAVYARVSTFLGDRAERKAQKVEAKLAVMTEDERRDYHKSQKIKAGMWVLFIGSAALAMSARGVYALGFGGGGSGSHDAATGLLPAKQDGQHGGSGAGSFRLAEAAADHKFNQYSPTDSSFYDFAHKQHRGDFGTPLVGSDKDGNKGLGYADWMSRNKHEPNGLGNLYVGLGLNGDDDSFEARNRIADTLNSDRIEHIKIDEAITKALDDPKRFKIETVSIDRPYTSTYMTDVNGDPVIGVEQHVDYGGTAFKITNAKTGEVTLWRKECGGFQQIWLEERPAPVVVTSEVQQVGYTATDNGGQQQYNYRTVSHTRTGTGGGTYVPPTDTVPPGNGGGTPPGNGGGNPPGGGGGNPPPPPHERKIWTGGVKLADGIRPELNKFLGITAPPEAGNGTRGANLNPGTRAGSEATIPDATARRNTAAQIAEAQRGANGTTGTNGDAQAQAARQAAQRGQARQAQLDAAAAARPQPGADAVDRAVRGMGSDGRPLKK